MGDRELRQTLCSAANRTRAIRGTDDRLDVTTKTKTRRTHQRQPAPKEGERNAIGDEVSNAANTITNARTLTQKNNH